MLTHHISVSYPLTWILFLGMGAVQLTTGSQGQFFFVNWPLWLGFCVLGGLITILWGIVPRLFASSSAPIVAGLVTLVVWGFCAGVWLFVMTDQGSYFWPSVDVLVLLSALSVGTASIFFLAILVFEGQKL